MYLGSWKIDDNLTFYCNTHTAATGAETDGDSAPTYRVYENETATPILTGTMALLDGDNTVGFYSEQITLSAANGFEKGKCYAIRISATVATIAGSTVDTFQIEAEVDSNTVSGNVTLAAATHTGAVIPTVTTLTNAPTGMALEATLTAIKGAGWSSETLKAIKDAVDLKLNALDYTAPPTAVDIATQVDTTLGASHGEGLWGSSAGSGSAVYTFTLTDSVTGLPIAGADVWLTTDVAGNNVVASGVTDASGTVTLYPDPGTYQRWCQRSGYNQSGPVAVTVT